MDSGNLAGHLLTLRPGLLALADAAGRRAALVRRAGRHAAVARRRPGRRGCRAAARRGCRTDLRCRAATRRRRRSRPRGSGSSRSSRRRTTCAARVAGLPVPDAAPTDTRAPRAPGDACVLGRSRSSGSAGCCAEELATLVPARQRSPPARARGDPDAARAGRARGRARDRATDAAGAYRATGAAVRGPGADGVRLPLRPRRATCSPSATTSRSARGDTSYYDLLASEARLASFVAIAQGQVPQEHWFALGRLLTTAGGEPVLLSWSGSMFEYLMPLLVMPAYEDTLLDQTCRAAVERQIAYGRQRGRAVGHLGVAATTRSTRSLNYQYRAFGVPGLGLKRGLAEDLVVAPYASALALMVAPEEACANLQRLAGDGLAGRFGLYEAIDYTPARLPRGQAQRRRALVHGAPPGHEPAVARVPAARTARCRSASRRTRSPGRRSCCCRSASPRRRALHPHSAEALRRPRHPRRAGSAGARAVDPRHGDPRGAAAVERPLPRDGHQRRRRRTAAGRTSPSRAGARTAPATPGARSATCATRRAGEFWSAAHQPTLKRADRYEAIFSEARAEFRRRDGDFESHTEIVVSPEDDIELRRAAHHQPLAHAAHDRAHQLRRGGAGAAGRRRAPPGLQQPLRADRDRARAARRSCARAGRAPGTRRRPGCST